MHDQRTISYVVDGELHSAPAGTTVAAALLNAEIDGFRRSVTDRPRGPLCGMGICYECRVSIDGVAHRRACLVPLAEGMVVVTARRPEP
jgi:predicted molibdopterin-dependent oxidoreductase YjgC